MAEDRLCGVNHAIAAAENLKHITQWKVFANLREADRLACTPLTAPATQI